MKVQSVVSGGKSPNNSYSPLFTHPLTLLFCERVLEFASREK